MEDALALFCVMPHSEQGQVLILVVMEDALAPSPFSFLVYGV